MYKIITGSVSHFKKVTFMSLQKLLNKNYVLCLFDCIGNNRIFFFKLLHNKQKKKQQKIQIKVRTRREATKYRKKSFCRRSQKV